MPLFSDVIFDIMHGHVFHGSMNRCFKFDVVYLFYHSLLIILSWFANVISILDHTATSSPKLQYIVFALQELYSSFFRQITFQLLHGAQERDKNLFDEEATPHNFELDGILLFIGETFSRICRRGASGN